MRGWNGWLSRRGTDLLVVTKRHEGSGEQPTFTDEELRASLERGRAQRGQGTSRASPQNMSRRQRRLHKQLIRKQEAERRAAEEAAQRSGAGGANAQNESDDEESVEVSVDEGAGQDADAAKQDSDDEGPLVDEEYGKEELPSGVRLAR